MGYLEYLEPSDEPLGGAVDGEELQFTLIINRKPTSQPIGET